MDNRLAVVINNTSPMLLGAPPLDIHTWHHLCLAIDDSTCTLFIGNRTHEIVHRNATKFPKMSGPDFGRVAMELGKNYSSFAFFGQVADVSLHRHLLTGEEIRSYIACGSDHEDGLEYFVDKDVRRRCQTLARSGMCRPRGDSFAALFPGLRDLGGSRAFCEHLGARLVNAGDDYAHTLSDILLNLNDGELTTAWTADQADGKHIILFLGKMGNDSSYTKMFLSNTTDAIKTLCVIPFGKKIYMLMDDRKEYKFFPRGGQPILQGMDSSIIFYSKCPDEIDETCLFYSEKTIRRMYHVYDGSDFLLGRRQWHSLEKGHGASERAIYVTLTVCKDTQYTCNNSQCIDLEMRCNGRADCEDLSDEGDTCKAMDKLPLTYWPGMCPQVSGKPPLISLSVQLNTIHEISLENNGFQATLKVAIGWHDNRLTFSNLGNCSHLFHPKLFRSIWVPGFNFDNANYDNNRNIHQGTEILEWYSGEANGANYTDVLQSFEGKYTYIHIYISQL